MNRRLYFWSLLLYDRLLYVCVRVCVCVYCIALSFSASSSSSKSSSSAFIISSSSNRSILLYCSFVSIFSVSVKLYCIVLICCYIVRSRIVSNTGSEWVSSFLTAHQHIKGSNTGKMYYNNNSNIWWKSIAILFAKKNCNSITILFAILDHDLMHTRQHNIQC